MEYRVINMPEKCGSCENEISDLFFCCRNCYKYLCEDCFGRHEDHRHVTFKKKGNKAILLINQVSGAGSIEQDEFGIKLPSLSINGINFQNNCGHIRNALKNNIIFYCETCKKYLCRDCVKIHNENHSIQLNTIKNDNLIQNLHYLHDTGLPVDVKIIFLKIEHSKTIKIPLKISFTNLSKWPIYDVKLTIIDKQKPWIQKNNIKLFIYVDSSKTIIKNYEYISIENYKNFIELEVFIDYHDVYGGTSIVKKEFKIPIK